MNSKRMKIKESLENTITYTARFSEDMHAFLKSRSRDQNRSMNLILEDCVKKYKKEFDELLT
tara:strand:- start:381 stop:566 length:186 start_codon:yes stop_codon:yes gene_type:complete